MSEVRLCGISKRYQAETVGSATERPALDRLDLTAASGQFVVLVGPSGCGKSTTLRIVAGLEATSTGRVFIGDRDVTHLSPADRDIAMVFQSYALYPHMSVFDNLAFALRLRKLPRNEISARVARVAQSLGLQDYLHRKPRALSGGQRQRVAIGRAVVREPKLFLFDEPLSNLDAKLRGEMRREIARIHAQSQTTSLYVTHDQVEAMTLADRIVVLRDGVLQQVGTPMEVYDRPANRFVAGFFGTPAMNILVAQLGVDAGRIIGNGFAFSLPGPQKAANGEILLGVRPESLQLDRPEGGVPIRAAVELREILGAEALLHLSSDAGPLTVRTQAHTDARKGDNLTAWIDPRHVHVFDAKTERRL